jgi:predicted nucleic acid-binding protein
MDGLDTGFFFDLWASTDRAQALWRAITEHDEPAAVSSVTLFECTRHGLVGRLPPSFTETIVGQADVAYEQAPIDPTEVLNRGARITHGMGLPMADALIAASLEHVGCDTLYTSDSDFAAYEGTMEIAFLS